MDHRVGRVGHNGDVLAVLSTSAFISSAGYVAIFVLCVAQSCCVPTSSELTLGFAGVLAATGHMSLPGAIAVGVAGEVVGAYLAWIIGRTGGRAFVDRFGKYVLLTHSDLDRAEDWYDRHQRWGVFGGRLIPVIRNFVALPAGVAEVPLLPFGLLTAAGSLIWDGAMAGIGYGVGTRWREILHLFSDAGYVIAVLTVLAIVLFFAHRWRSYKATRDLGRASGERRARSGPRSGTRGMAASEATAVPQGESGLRPPDGGTDVDGTASSAPVGGASSAAAQAAPPQFPGSGITRLEPSRPVRSKPPSSAGPMAGPGPAR
ncbi:MAG: DedA family protein [Actinomycetota bacterium]|jgi:membrane protein DedA with SNARE-associated domain|nr:DedA family protein [Actinomycetota bacterium]